MRLIAWSLVGAACAAAIFASPSAKAANVPLCLAIAQNYNNCVRQSHFAHRRGYGHAYPGGPYGDYGDYGGYDGDDGPAYGPGYGGYRRQERAKAACAVWFAQMQASGCFD